MLAAGGIARREDEDLSLPQVIHVDSMDSTDIPWIPWIPFWQ
jgi:hypothetical protein